MEIRTETEFVVCPFCGYEEAESIWSAPWIGGEDGHWGHGSRYHRCPNCGATDEYGDEQYWPRKEGFKIKEGFPNREFLRTIVWELCSYDDGKWDMLEEGKEEEVLDLLVKEILEKAQKRRKKNE